MKRLGIVGGMGPAATARLFSQVVSYTAAECDQDHLDVTILNRPAVIPDRTAFLLGRDGASPFGPVLTDLSLELCADGCEVLAMPCNTAHAAYEEIVAALPTSVSFVHMLDETARFLAGEGKRRVGVLATDGTLQASVYHKALDAAGLSVVVPPTSVQQIVMNVIYEYLKAGKPVPNAYVEAMLDALVDAGCDAIVIGCTELSLLGVAREYRGCRVVDALDVLAWKCVQLCGAPASRTP